MRKTIAILLITLYVFNAGGYRILFYWMQQQTNNRLEVKLDKNEYSEADLIEFSIPLNLPYQNDGADFERIDGEIVINGTPYHFVKKMVKNNCLLIKCIPNNDKKIIIARQEAVFKSINGLQQYGGANKLISNCCKLSPLGSSEYLQQSSFYLQPHNTRLLTAKISSINSTMYTSSFCSKPGQPPEAQSTQA